MAIAPFGVSFYGHGRNKANHMSKVVTQKKQWKGSTPRNRRIPVGDFFIAQRQVIYMKSDRTVYQKSKCQPRNKITKNVICGKVRCFWFQNI